jgi:hypothetical protein
MARIDDYRTAVALAKEQLKTRDPHVVAELSGGSLRTDSSGKTALVFQFLDRRASVIWPELDVLIEASQEEIPVQQQVLALHYLNGAVGSQITGEWIAYQELPDGKFYVDAFQRRAKIPMVQAFGHRPELLVKLAREKYNTVPFNQGDHSVVVQAFPWVPVALVLWEGDDEFPPEGTFLFDRSISRILSAEDIAWLAGMIIYPLVGMAKGGEHPIR